MIAFYAQGGLGNQLFQYAMAANWARTLDCELVADTYWFAHPQAGETPRQFELDKYEVSLRRASETEQKKWRRLHSRYARLISFRAPLRLVSETGHVQPIMGNSYLRGFWQSEKYFVDIRPQLLQAFTPKLAPGPKDLEVLNLISRSSAPVCLHIRRGDYVSLASASSFHGLCAISYYHAAVDWMAKRLQQPTFFIFSDDPEWARKNLVLPFTSYYVAHNEAKDAFQDLRLMQHCQHHIIANSSFSWWGAWLADSPSQLVVAPKQWFAAIPTPEDLIPERWQQL